MASLLLRKLLCVSLLLSSVAHAYDRAPLVSTTFVRHDNVTNSDRAAAILPAAQTIADIYTENRLLLARLDTLLLSAHLRSEVSPRYDGLDRTAPGFLAQWQHKSALGALAPVVRVDVTGDTVVARDPGRSDLIGSAAFSDRERLNEIFLRQVRHEVSRHDERAVAFDRTGRETSALLGWQTATPSFFDLTLRRRYGDFLAYSSPPRPDLVAKGKRLTYSDRFDHRGSLIAYCFPAATDSYQFGDQHALAPGDSLAVHIAVRRTAHGQKSYRNRVASLRLPRQF